MDFDFETKSCEDISQNCSNEQCFLYKSLGLSVEWNGTKILGDMRFHKCHAYENALQFIISFYEIRHFTVGLNLKMKKNNENIITLKAFDKSSKYGETVSTLCQNSVTKKLSPNSPSAYYGKEVPFLGDITSNLNLSITGDIYLKFNLSPTNLLKTPSKITHFKSLLCENAFENFASKKDFTVFCQGNRFYFNKTLLSMISEVFEKMIQDSDSKEAQNNSVEIEDFSPDTIENFQKIAFESENAKNEDLTPDLLLFAQKYLIMPLVEKCKKHLINSMTCDNIFEIIKVAYLIDDDDMLKTASKFFSRNIDQLKSTEELKDFQKLNPMCMIKVFNYINGIEN